MMESLNSGFGFKVDRWFKFLQLTHTGSDDQRTVFAHKLWTCCSAWLFSGRLWPILFHPFFCRLRMPAPTV